MGRQATRRVIVSGGIASGKSTVSRIMGDLGAVVIDADEIGHEMLAPGGPVFEEVRRRWPQVVVDGLIDRRRLAAVAFADSEALARLEAITHPAIGARIGELVDAAGDRDVVVEVPVVEDLPGDGWTRVVIDADPALRAERAVSGGFEEEDVHRRMTAQPGRDVWLASADHVIVNDGDLMTLRSLVEDLWRELGKAAGRPSMS